MNSLVNSTKYLRKRLYQCTPIYFRDKSRANTLHTFYETIITLIIKPDKDIAGKLQTITCEHRCNNPQQYISKSYPKKSIKRVIYHNQLDKDYLRNHTTNVTLNGEKLKKFSN